MARSFSMNTRGRVNLMKSVKDGARIEELSRTHRGISFIRPEWQKSIKCSFGIPVSQTYIQMHTGGDLPAWWSSSCHTKLTIECTVMQMESVWCIVIGMHPVVASVVAEVMQRISSLRCQSPSSPFALYKYRKHPLGRVPLAATVSSKAAHSS